ncbi:hypothetical protein Sango_0359300 [Sesamum angolense]|uniref:Uncharacterized protein n=1 Tax=Sesamum angolense TaxID=2727404 RepID=A0AAE1X9M2_9LAMI|nr:hypothetical protein Sango_0359300 [Sesamum angolense]
MITDARQEIQTVYVAAESQPITETVSGKGTDLVSDLKEALKILQNKEPQDPIQVYFAKLDEMADEDIYMVLPEGSSIPAGKVCKRKCSLDIIQDTGLTSADSASTPLPTGLKLSAYASSELSDPEPYRRLGVWILVAQLLGSALISWKTKKQMMVARSTAEAKYQRIGTTACELQWISYLLQDF